MVVMIQTHTQNQSSFTESSLQFHKVSCHYDSQTISCNQLISSSLRGCSVTSIPGVTDGIDIMKNKSSKPTTHGIVKVRKLKFECAPNVLLGKRDETANEKNQIQVVLKKNLGEEKVDMKTIYRPKIVGSSKLLQ